MRNELVSFYWLKFDQINVKCFSTCPIWSHSIHMSLAFKQSVIPVGLASKTMVLYFVDRIRICIGGSGNNISTEE